MSRSLLVMAALLPGLVACGGESAPASTTRASWNLPVTRVTAGTPQDYTAVGSVASDARIEVASRLSGYLRELHVREGDRVHRGRLLARVDAPDVDGAIGQARARKASAEAAASDAQIDAERFSQLFAKGMVSESDMRKVRLKLDATREDLNQAQAALNSAEAQRGYASITSPQDGVVVAVLRRPGDLVVPGAPILLVESARDLVFETTVTERQVAAVRVGQRVTVRVDGLDLPVNGHVARVVLSADPVTRTYPVKIAMPATSGLLPGMFGRADFPLGNSDTMVIDRKLLVDRAGLRGVFVVDAQDTLRFRWLRIGREWPDRVEVLAGLAPGERAAGNVGATVREGDRVTATTTAAPAKQDRAP
jgi:multidrug efflux system membrane fusion protein